MATYYLGESRVIYTRSRDGVELDKLTNIRLMLRDGLGNTIQLTVGNGLTIGTVPLRNIDDTETLAPARQWCEFNLKQITTVGDWERWIEDESGDVVSLPADPALTITLPGRRPCN